VDVHNLVLDLLRLCPEFLLDLFMKGGNVCICRIGHVDRLDV